MSLDDFVKRWGPRVAMLTGIGVILGALFRFLIWPALPIASKEALAATQQQVEALKTNDAVNTAIIPRIEKKVDNLGQRMDALIDQINAHNELDRSRLKRSQ